MDLIWVVVVCVAIGFFVWLLTTKVPMPPYWAPAIQLLAIAAIALYLLRVFGAGIPNVLP